MAVTTLEDHIGDRSGGQSEAEKTSPSSHVDFTATPNHALEYEDAELEPELHARTYVAFAAMLLLNFVQVFALTGPPAVVSC